MSERQVKRLRAIKEILSAAEPFVERNKDNKNFPCHSNLVPVEKCDRCKRVARLRKATDRLAQLV